MPKQRQGKKIAFLTTSIKQKCEFEKQQKYTQCIDFTDKDKQKSYIMGNDEQNGNSKKERNKKDKSSVQNQEESGKSLRI